jgi:glucose/arabinose dehydrogenase
VKPRTPLPGAAACLVIVSCSGGGRPASPGYAAVTDGPPDATVVAVVTAPPDASVGDAENGSTPDTAPYPEAPDARPVLPIDDASMPPRGTFCALPGSVLSTPQGLMVVPGGDDASASNMTWLDVPPGFCAHFFAHVPHTRQLRFAQDGDLFVASPSTYTPGGSAEDGLGAVLVLPDDDHDGVADPQITFLPNAAAGQPGISSTQGLMFANGYFYYEDVDPAHPDTFFIRRVPFQRGDRRPRSRVETVTTMKPPAVPQMLEHWPKMLDIAQDGTIYVTNGSGQSQECLSPSSSSYVPVFGAIFKINPDGTITEVARGFRNPIALRCEPNHDVCLAVELALDGSGYEGGREKVVPVRPGDDWGYPCCATQNVAYAGTTYRDNGGAPDCSGVTADTVSFTIGHTPFGIDFETGAWPAPWTGRAFVVLHGVVGSWEGARIVGLGLDPTTGALLPGSELYEDAATADNMLDFATGWYRNPFGTTPGHSTGHGRPSAIAFAPDGRMFVGDDWGGVIFWVAPVDLLTP